MNSESEVVKRNIAIRVMVFILWLILFELVGSILIGQSVMYFSGENMSTHQGQVNAHLVYMRFMGNYGGWMILSFAILVSILSFFKILPGVRKFKKIKTNA